MSTDQHYSTNSFMQQQEPVHPALLRSMESGLDECILWITLEISDAGAERNDLVPCRGPDCCNAHNIPQKRAFRHLSGEPLQCLKS
jgi:hypothetical protein